MAYYPVSGAAFVVDVPWPMRYVVRAPNAAALAGPVREALRRLDPALPVFGVETLETRVGRARGTRAFVMVLLVVAAGLALLLGAVGLYGVVSYTVAQRRCEIAIRMAVGAQVGHVRWLVLAEAGGLARVGMALGVGAALALTGQLRAILVRDEPARSGCLSWRVGVSGFGMSAGELGAGAAGDAGRADSGVAGRAGCRFARAASGHARTRDYRQSAMAVAADLAIRPASWLNWPVEEEPLTCGGLADSRRLWRAAQGAGTWNRSNRESRHRVRYRFRPGSAASWA